MDYISAAQSYFLKDKEDNASVSMSSVHLPRLCLGALGTLTFPVRSSPQDDATCPVILVAFMLSETLHFSESKLTCQLVPWPVTPFSDDSVLP
jgi:hypothetical protein